MAKYLPRLDVDTPLLCAIHHQDFHPHHRPWQIGDQLWKRVGREPSGTGVQLYRAARKRNRAGPAIPSSTLARLVTTDEVLTGREPREIGRDPAVVRAAASDDKHPHQ